MNTYSSLFRRPTTCVLACAVSYCLFFASLASTHTHAQPKKKAKPAPASIVITQKDPNAVLRPGAGVTFSAKVFSKSGELLEGGEVKWSTTGSNAVTAGQFVDNGSTHEATLIGFSPDGRPATSALINLTASVANGSVSSTIRDIPFRANLTIEVEAPPRKLAPGESYLPKATVKDGDVEIPDAHVRWTYATPGDRDFVLLARDSKDVYSAVALKPPKDKSAPPNVVIVANYGGAVTPVSIPYGEGTGDAAAAPTPDTAQVDDITVERKGGNSPFDPSDFQVEPGQRLALKASLKVPDADSGKPKPEISWKVPPEMMNYVAMLPQSDADKKGGVAVFYGLIPDPGSVAGQGGVVPDTLYVLVQAVDKTKGKDKEKDKEFIKFVKAVAIRNGEQTVDVSWDILPPDVVAKNYGRGISDKYYAIEVVVGNNSGYDLQLTGMSFRLDNPQPGDMSGNGNSAFPVSVVSYDAVRGLNEQKRFAFNRSTILGGLDAAAQFLTGFNPFFHVASHARNFSQGINILGNPVTKGIERVWPDPQQDELNRLEQQALHDDKIIPNNSVQRTTIFVPKESVLGYRGAASNGQQAGGLNENDLLAVRRRLGQLILVGSKLNRNEFSMRIRQGSRSPAVSANH